MSIESILKGRKGMYEFLATVLLDAPPRNFLEDLMKGEISFPPHPLIDDGARTLSELAGRFKSANDFERFVRQEYTAVFVNPFDSVVSLYQSVYESNTPYRDVTLRIKRKYIEMGYLLQKPTEPADHIGIELMFMAESCKAALEGHKIEELKKQKKFLEEEILRWVFRFCDALENNGNAHFYKGISKILRGFMQIEKRIGDLVSFCR
jgi:TorA maturation chaperone TorD